MTPSTLSRPPTRVTLSLAGDCTIRRAGEIWARAVPCIRADAEIFVDATNLEAIDASLVQLLCMVRLNVAVIEALDPTGKLTAEFERHGIEPLSPANSN
ncbi:STAS domain-containing protein [Nibricoccus sp. IMCC34717]|uniref:STAS domain-containing protein n=1 Tax=Nibricoccus sp. IMCC34717 TaxID=3034021 RepID=UPI00384D2FE5